MTNQDLAKFYNISAQAVGRWSVEKRKQKTVQALSGAEQPICDIIAEISKLVFIFNCKWLHGIKQEKCMDIAVNDRWLTVTGTEFWLNVRLDDSDVVKQLHAIKTKLEELVYGVQAIA